MFQVKICGLTQASDAEVAIAAGADAIGLNFVPASPRCLSLATAAELTATIDRRAQRVGVFVNQPAADILAIVRKVSLDVVQLHGDEPPEAILEFGSLPVVRAFRGMQQFSQAIREFLDRCDALGRLPDAVLIDAYQPGSYGGTGQRVDWQRVPDLRAVLRGVPLVLAGGLTAENVAEAIRIARPDAVDTASGVENSPGVKDHELVRAFCAKAFRSFSQTGQNL